MYSFVILSAMVCVVFGEAPYYSPSYSSVLFQRSIQPPYAPSGYRPNEPQFYFPSLRLQQAPVEPQDPRVSPQLPQQPGQVPLGVPIPRDRYNPQQPAVPAIVSFGRPKTTSTTEAEPVEGTTTEAATETTTELADEDKTQKNRTREVENIEDVDASKEQDDGDLKTKDELVEEGVYYIFHPSGLLQKVAYNSKNNFAKMDYTAMLKYENVDPIKEPIYTYDPNTYVFSQLSV